MTIDEQFEKLENTVREYNPGADFKRIRESYEFAKQHHGEQRRKSGELYITHPLAVAQIVAEELHLDSESIEAALLHDVIEDTDATYDDVAKLTSPTVADLVEGVSKLTRIQYATKEDEQMENLRKMLIAMSKDIRVILIKISDRLHNMRTMEYQTPAKQKQKSLETMEIYAPIAHRLGMQRMKWELEDLSLKYLDPIGYDEIVSKLDAKRPEYDALMSRTQAQIDQRLNEMGIKHIVYGRMKHPYSIYRKMFSQNKSLDEIFDLFAFRVVVDTVSDCYNVLGVIHDLYKPILGRFKDYIGTPKPNGYQSLHTTVMGNEGIPFEVQIRTTEMHEIAEYGVAAHWKYKQNGQGAGTEGKYEWVRRLLENQEGADAEEFIHSLKVDMFSDEVFVFTPNGDVQNLPAGAIPIDFAYAIHSAVGNRMIGAKVNNRIVTLDHVLKNGDIVALDAKITLDDKALFRHPENSRLKDDYETGARELKAGKYGFTYHEFNGSIGCIVNGEGLAMAMAELLKRRGSEVACWLNVKGGVDRDKIAAGIKIIATNPRVEGIVINILGGFVRCDLIADGIIDAAAEVGMNIPLVVRFEGTNRDEAENVLKRAGLPLTLVRNMEDAADEILRLVREGE